METQIQPNASPLPAPAEMMSAEELVAWALDRWHPRIAVCTSFQAEGMVILDLCWRYRKDVRVMTIDTGRLPAETYEMMDRIRDHYGIRPEVFFPHAESVETMVQESGANLFYRSREERKRCCSVRKVEPLARMLQPLDAWMVGLRRDQSSSRAGVCKLETDWEHGSKIKLSPLADWTHDQVWNYIRRTGFRIILCMTRVTEASAVPPAVVLFVPASTHAPDAGGGNREAPGNAGSTVFRKPTDR